MKKLNKFISDSGYCSRREADAYISQGRVMVNGVEAKIGDMIEDGDMVEVDGEKVGRTPKRRVYIAFNKPVGVTSTTNREDKSNIVDFIGHKERIFPVGRLDKDSEGLIILTNDGDIVNKILRAGNNNPKEYIVTVDKPITSEFISNMSKGVRILGTVTKPCKVVKKNEKTFNIHLTQGLNRQIRRMTYALGYKVVSLRRVRVINISLGNLAPGEWRYFTQEETVEMQRILEAAIGTQEASKTSSKEKKSSFADYRKRGKSRNAASSSAGGDGKKSGQSRSKPGAGRSAGAKPSRPFASSSRVPKRGGRK